MKNETVDILGFRINNVKMSETIEKIKEFIHSGIPHQVITANSLMLNAAINNRQLKNVFAGSALVVPDSIGMLVAGKILGQPLIERVTGIDLMYHLFALCQKEGLSIYLLGAKPGVAAQAAERIRGQFSGLKISGAHHGYFDAQEEGKVIAEIKNLKPDLLFVGLNIPHQEMWIAERLADLGVPVAMGIGGSFDVISGHIKRAPAVMQQAGLEWLWRTIVEPWRIKRIVLLPVFLGKVYRQKWQDKIK